MSPGLIAPNAEVVEYVDWQRFHASVDCQLVILPVRPIKSYLQDCRYGPLPAPRSLFEPNPHRLSVCHQPFEFGQADDRSCVPVESGSRIGNHVGLFQKIIHPERGSKTGSARCRKHVIWAGKVISDRLRSMVPNKDRPRIFNPAEPGKRIFEVQFEVFRCYPICKFESRINALHYENGSVALD